MTFRMIALRAAVLASYSCSMGPGGEPIPPEQINHAIVSGNNQSQPAGTMAHGARALADPVVQQIAKEPITGSVPKRSRWLGYILPLAHAQDPVTVKGSPVPGAVVCAASIEDGLVPFNICTNTDANGRATFFFYTPTKAGVHRAEIRGVVGGQPAVFDTVRATITHGPPDPNMEAVQEQWPTQSSPAILPVEALRDVYGNPVPYRIRPDSFGFLTVLDTLSVGTQNARTVTFTDSSGSPGFSRRTGIIDASGNVVATLQFKIQSNLRISWATFVPKVGSP